MSPTCEDHVAQGYGPAFNTQFNIFLENRVGKLRELLDVFEGRPLRVVALDILDSTDHAVARLLTTHAEAARQLLASNRFPFAESPVIIVEVSGTHSLLGICTTLLAAEISIHYAYGLLVHPHNHPALAIHTDDETLAAQLLLKKNYTLLGENDLGENATGNDPFGS